MVHDLAKGIDYMEIPPSEASQPVNEVPSTSPVPEASRSSDPGQGQVANPFSYAAPTPSGVCSENRCAAGHRWRPLLALQDCPGCGCQVLLVKMENCPTCNEPVTQTSFRSDHLGPGMHVAAMCQGEPTKAEATKIELEREHALLTEQGK